MPHSRSGFVIFFLGIWICGWGVAEYMVARQYLNGDAPPEGEMFMLAWFAVWTISGFLAMYAFLWQIMGREIVTVHRQMFQTKHDIGGFGFRKAYDLAQMRDLRAAPVSFNPLDLSSSLQLWGIGGGVVAFEYGPKTIRLGAGLTETEAKEVVAAITQRRRSQKGTS